MLKLKLQYFGHWMRRTDSMEKIMMLGKTEGGRERGGQRMRWLMGSPTLWTWVWVGSRSWWWTGKPGVLQSMESQRVRHDWVTERNWNIRNILQGLHMATSYIQVNSTWKTYKMIHAHPLPVRVHGGWTWPSSHHMTDSVQSHSCHPQTLCTMNCNKKTSLNIVHCCLEPSDLHLNLECAFLP